MIFNKDKMKKMSESEKKAKMTALKEAHGMASDMLKDKVSGLKKVTVASDSKEGLKKGLEKAEEIIGENESEDEEMGEKDEAEASEYEDQQEESEPMDEDEINAQIEHLMKLKEKLSK
jgi:hypothetical protein